MNLERLGEFVRSRRAALRPEPVGFQPSPKRKSAGLRREEVAELAGISLDWYTRIELAKAGVPSRATLYAVARALQLNDVETRYLFELAGFLIGDTEQMPALELPAASVHIVSHLADAAVTVFDRYSTPHRWNAIADAIFRWSAHGDAFHRNLIVAGLSDEYYRVLAGSEYETVARGIIGSFRRAFTTSEPTALARRIFDFGMENAMFRAIWNETIVTEVFTDPEPFFRHVPQVGTLWLDYVDLTSPQHADLHMRILTAHDAETREKLRRLSSNVNEPTRTRTP
jgi:transcriptional regulator with XRE-family HTH domain